MAGDVPRILVDGRHGSLVLVQLRDAAGLLLLLLLFV
jgi:hypothetical protein